MDPDTILINRQAAVAGQFYNANPKSLKEELKKLFAHAVPKKVDHVMAIISPHAGYLFSGGVAASGFNQINPQEQYKNIFIIASSHKQYFDGASVYNQGNYETPLGEVKVNIELANDLIKNNKCFNSDPTPHSGEHSLEVQLPFLQYLMLKEFKMVPVILGTNFPHTCKEIALALKPYFIPGNLFIISTDFSHYPAYDDAVKIDKATADAILQNSSEILINTLKDNDSIGYHNHSTSLCGWTSVLTLLYMTEGNPDIFYTHIDYKNSGDSPFGDKSGVVGYNAIAVATKKSVNDQDEEFALSNDDKKKLLEIARNSMNEYIVSNKESKIDAKGFSKTLLTKCGVFVSLYKGEKLRGCVGQFEPGEPLYKVIQQMAIAASTEDYRFDPVSKDEIVELEIEISVLSSLRKIKSIDEIQLGKHGIYIKKDHHGGTFLPQVASETKWSREEFLGHCARDKAGLAWDEWNTADIFIYETNVFGEGEEDMKM